MARGCTALLALGLVLLASAPAQGAIEWRHAGAIQGTRSPQIFDADATRIMYTDGAALLVLDRRSGQITPIAIPAGQRLFAGELTARGAIVEVTIDGSSSHRIREWRDGVLLDLGPGVALTATGGFAVWNGEDPNTRNLYRRDIGAGSTQQISSSALVGRDDVAANGDVVFSNQSPPHHVYRYRAGVTTQMSATVAARSETWPLTDGVNVAYRRSPPTESGQWSLAMANDAGEVALGASDDDPRPNLHYAVAGGWVAAVRRGGDGIREVVMRSPGGSSSIVYRGASASDAPFIRVLSPDGRALVGTDQLRLVRPGAQPRIVPFPPNGTTSTTGFTVIGGAIHASVGTDLHRLAVDEPAPPAYRDQVMAEPSLRSYWRLGEASGTTAADQRGVRPGTYAGGVRLAQPGAVPGDSAASFDGLDDRVTLPAIGSEADFTVEGWTKLRSDASESPGGANTLLGSWSRMRLIVRPGGVYADAWVGGAQFVWQGATADNVGKWVHWALVRSGGSLTVYRNGVPFRGRTDLAPGAVLLAGAIGLQDGLHYPLHGLADEIAVYGAAVSQQALLDHYHAGNGG